MKELRALPKIKLDIYNHYRGLRYEVLAVVRNSETTEPMVLYKLLYGEQGMWVLPYEMFCEDISVEGLQLKRFELEKACEN
jgi:hypothetical protein